MPVYVWDVHLHACEGQQEEGQEATTGSGANRVRGVCGLTECGHKRWPTCKRGLCCTCVLLAGVAAAVLSTSSS